MECGDILDQATQIGGERQNNKFSGDPHLCTNSRYKSSPLQERERKKSKIKKNHRNGSHTREGISPLLNFPNTLFNMNYDKLEL